MSSEIQKLKQQLNDHYGKGAIFMDNPNVPRNEVGDESNIDLLQEHLNQYSKDIDSSMQVLAVINPDERDTIVVVKTEYGFTNVELKGLTVHFFKIED